MNHQMAYDAETALIGGLVSDFARAKEVLKKLDASDFECTQYAEIFQICKNHEQDISKDFVHFWENAKGKDIKDAALNAAELFIGFGTYSDYIRIVRSNSQNRKLRARLDTILMDGGDLLPALRQIVEQQADPEDCHQAIFDVGGKFIEELYATNDKRVHTGFSRLDKAIGGFRMKTISYIGARPSTGKTAFALNVIRNQRKAGTRVLMFSLEMSSTQILERMTSDLCSINYGRINERTIGDNEKRQLVTAEEALLNGDMLYINDNAYTVEAMEKIIAAYRPQFVVVDFMQFVKTVKRFQNRRNEIDYISGEFKRIARQNDCHIMILSQLTRAGKDAPSMSDLKESGALEQDGDYILLLHRPYVLDKTEGTNPEETEVKLDKNKYGRCGVASMRFMGEYQRFVSEETRYE